MNAPSARQYFKPHQPAAEHSDLPRTRMPRAALRPMALLAAVLLGALADALLNTGGRPGLNLALWALAGVVVLAWLLQYRTHPPARETKWLVGGALAFAGTLAVRDAEFLAVFSVLAAVGLLVLAAGRATAVWVSRALPSDVAFSGVRVGLLCVAGPLGWRRGARAEASVDHAESGGGGVHTARAGWSGTARTVARGAAMALPPLFVLTALLVSADPVFGHLVEATFAIDLAPDVAEHLMVAAVIAWLTAGLLRGFLVPDDAVMSRLRVPQPSLPAAELSVALWVLNVLFLGFMAVQLRYLFGGADVVEVTTGLTYATYARRGFFELVASALLVVPILLLADWAAASHPSRGRRWLRATMLVLVMLMIGVIASAAYRMRLYQEAYGLTELRLFVSVVIVWLTALFVWLVLTVLRGRRDRFVFGGVVLALAGLAALHAMNPHALIARVNLARAAAGAETDLNYLRTLSADAVPVLMSRVSQLPRAERCQVERLLVERWGGTRPGGWRTWNASDARARLVVGARVFPAELCPSAERAPDA